MWATLREAKLSGEKDKPVAEYFPDRSVSCFKVQITAEEFNGFRSPGESSGFVGHSR